jgi:hypothetical protein
MNRLPRGVEWLLRVGLPADQREPIAGDLDEEYRARVQRAGVIRASLIIWWQAARLALTFRWERTAYDRPLPPIADEAPRRFTVIESIAQDAFFAARLLRQRPSSPPSPWSWSRSASVRTPRSSASSTRSCGGRCRIRTRTG